MVDSRWLRFVMLAAGCLLLAAGIRLCYLIYREGIPAEMGSLFSRSIRREAARESSGTPPRLTTGVDSTPVAPSPAPAVSPLPLAIVTEQLPMGVVGSEYSQSLAATGTAGPVVWTLAAGELPPGLELFPEGIISGVPGAPGEWRFTVGLLEVEGGTAEKDLRLLVRIDPEGVEGGLRIVTGQLPPGRLGRDYLGKLEAEGGETPYRWYLEDGELPEGLRLGPDSGVLFGLPRAAGEFEFTISIFDRKEGFAVSDYTLRIAPGGVEIVTAALPPAVKDETYLLTLRARGGAVPYTWQLTEGRLPEGLEFDPDRGIISGVPERWETRNFTVRVTDREGGWDVREFELTMGVIAEGELRIVTGTLPTAVLGEVYQALLETAGGLAPYIWTVSAGELPPSLGLDAESGMIRGFPELPGKAFFTVMVSDAEERTARQDLELLVEHQVLYLTTGDLPASVAGEDYQFLLGATGGSPPYFFSLDLGHLPHGLTLVGTTGLIEGTVSDIYLRKGDQGFRFRVRVTDQEGRVDIAEFNLLVSDPLEPLLAAIDRGGTTPRPIPTITPAGMEDSVSGLLGAVSNAKVGLAWINPTGEDFAEVRVVRRTAGYPREADDGTIIYAGRGNNLVDAGLENRRRYFYAVIPYNRDGYPGEIEENNRISLTPRAVSIFGANDPFADEVVSFRPLAPSGQNPAAALGAPSGRGLYDYSRNVVSLHARSAGEAEADPPYGGTIILKFTGNMVVNDSGPDFTVFENPCYPEGAAPEERWMEPAVVAVSQDGENWREFPFRYSLRYDRGGMERINISQPYSYRYGFAGINPVFSHNGYPDPTNPAVSGGDHFDLDDLPGEPFTWIQYLRITSTGDRWLAGDNGTLIRHTDYRGSLSGTDSSGFDLDAVSAINY